MLNNSRRFDSSISSDSLFDLVRALVLLGGIVALLGLLYLTQSSQATMTGKRVVELQTRLEQLQRENVQLEYEIAVLTAPDKMAERARRLGLRPATPQQMTYLVLKEYPTMPPKSSPLVQNVINPPGSADPLEALWNELLARLGWRANGRIVEASP